MTRALRPVTIDPSGRTLEVIIRIGPDGRVYFQDLPPAMVEVAAAISPEDAVVQERLRQARAFLAAEGAPRAQGAPA